MTFVHIMEQISVYLITVKLMFFTSCINNLRISALLGSGSSQISYDESHSQVLSTSLLFLENFYRMLEL